MSFYIIEFLLYKNKYIKKPKNKQENNNIIISKETLIYYSILFIFFINI